MAELVQRGVCKTEIRLALSKCLDDGAVRDTTQCKHHRVSRQQLQLVCQKGIAVVDLGADGLVIGRQTFNRIRDSALAKNEAVIACDRFCRGRKTVLVQHLVKKDTRVIARKGPPGSVGSMQTGSQSDNQKSCGRITKRWHRPAVVAGMAFFDRIQKTGKPRAGTTVPVKN